MSSILQRTNNNAIKIDDKGVIKINIIETTYSYVLKTVFGIANPIKKTIIKTECQVHKHININALKILKNDQYQDEHNFFNSFILDINEGAEWADQDFKSSNHFYHPENRKKDGLYGRQTAMDLGIDYYLQALNTWRNGDFKSSLFYLGAALHIIQDMTIPQHANIRLLDNHRQYENFVKQTYDSIVEFNAEKGAYLLDSIESYIKYNSQIAIKIYKKYNGIKNEEYRYYQITKCALPLAVRTTAGAMIMFYNDVL